jgi:hypothetical protein
MQKITRYYWVLASFVCVVLLASWHNRLPKIFLIGDSISIHYSPYLEIYLKEKAVFDRKIDNGLSENNLDVPQGANGGDSRMVLSYLKIKVNEQDFKPDYLLLNCGLHDIKREILSHKIQVSEEEYRQNLESIVKLLKRKSIQLIWIRTTAVIDSIHNATQRSFYRYSKDLFRYNQIADEVCLKNKVPVIDLYSFAENLGSDRYIDHVHYREPVRALQAAYIVGCIDNYLKNRKY